MNVISEHIQKKDIYGNSNITKIANMSEAPYIMFAKDQGKEKTFAQIPRLILNITKKAIARTKVVNGYLPNEGKYENRQKNIAWTDSQMQ